MKKAFSVLVILFIAVQLNAQWVKTGGPFGETINSLATNENNIYASTNWGVYLSTNNGTNWSLANGGLNNFPYVNSFTFSGNNIFGCGNGVVLSTNNGAAWASIDSGLTILASFLSLAVNGTNIFTSTWDGIHLSTNNGTSWTLVNNGLPVFLYYKPFTNILTVSGTNIFVGTQGNGIYLSTNNGTNWNQVNNGLDTKYGICSFVVSGNNIFAGTYNSVFLSTNNGTNWKQTANGLPGYYISSLAASGTNIFASTDSGGVYLSTNNGTNWKQINNGLINTDISGLTICGTDILAGTNGAGVWRRPLSELTGVSNEVKVLPQEYILFQNYPNPFNPSTVIKYAIPFESNVNIRFYNSLGQIVREVNEGNRQPGSYEINFTSSGLASGIYFYSIRAVSSVGKKDFSAVKKMILLK